MNATEPLPTLLIVGSQTAVRSEFVAKLQAASASPAHSKHTNGQPGHVAQRLVHLNSRERLHALAPGAWQVLHVHSQLASVFHQSVTRLQDPKGS